MSDVAEEYDSSVASTSDSDAEADGKKAKPAKKEKKAKKATKVCVVLPQLSELALTLRMYMKVFYRPCHHSM